MKQLAVLLLVFGCGASACMPFKYYPLPVSHAEARSTFAPIATAASNLGYKQWQWDDSVSFEPDPKTRVTYMFGVSGEYLMCVTLKDKNLPGGIEAGFVAGKAKGDDVWNRAMALRAATMPVVVMPAEAPPPSPSVQININR